MAFPGSRVLCNPHFFVFMYKPARCIITSPPPPLPVSVWEMKYVPCITCLTGVLVTFFFFKKTPFLSLIIKKLQNNIFYSAIGFVKHLCVSSDFGQKSECFYSISNDQLTITHAYICMEFYQQMKYFLYKVSIKVG